MSQQPINQKQAPPKQPSKDIAQSSPRPSQRGESHDSNTLPDNASFQSCDSTDQRAEPKPAPLQQPLPSNQGAKPKVPTNDIPPESSIAKEATVNGLADTKGVSSRTQPIPVTGIIIIASLFLFYSLIIYFSVDSSGQEL